METPKELVENYFGDWLKSDEAKKLDLENAGKLDVKERCRVLAKEFLEYLMRTQPDELWHLADTNDILYRALEASDQYLNNPKVYGDEKYDTEIW